MDASILKCLLKFDISSLNALRLFLICDLVFQIHLGPYQGLLPFIRGWSLDASALADIDLEEAVLDPAFFQFFKKFHTGFQPINMYFIVIVLH